MSYDVFTTGKVEKAIARLPEDAYQRMNDAIDAIADDPRPPGCEKLSGREGYRIRVGEWRAIYRVDDQHLTFALHTSENAAQANFAELHTSYRQLGE